MTDTRVHSCGQPMTPAVFDHNNPTRQYRSQPIWKCRTCNAWEPRVGWNGSLPAGWDGQAWTGQP